MFKKSKVLLAVASVMFLGVTLSSGNVIAEGKAKTGTKKVSRVAQGKSLAFQRKKGNCLSCHAIKGGVAAGNVAPPLVAMKARYPNKNDLRKQIWDASKNKPRSIMPLFGRHEILTRVEFEKLVDYIYTL